MCYPRYSFLFQLYLHANLPLFELLICFGSSEWMLNLKLNCVCFVYKERMTALFTAFRPFDLCFNCICSLFLCFSLLFGQTELETQERSMALTMVTWKNWKTKFLLKLERKFKKWKAKSLMVSWWWWTWTFYLCPLRLLLLYCLSVTVSLLISSFWLVLTFTRPPCTS